MIPCNCTKCHEPVEPDIQWVGEDLEQGIVGHWSITSPCCWEPMYDPGDGMTYSDQEIIDAHWCKLCQSMDCRCDYEYERSLGL